VKKVFKSQKIEDLVITFNVLEDDISIVLSDEESKFKVYKTIYLPEENRSKVPNLIFKAIFIMPKSKFVNVIKLANAIGEESLRLSCVKGKLNVNVQGEDSSLDAKSLAKAIGSSDCKTNCSLEYLNRILCSKEKLLTGQELMIYLSEDYPVKIADEYGDWFILAPRVEND